MGCQPIDQERSATTPFQSSFAALLEKLIKLDVLFERCELETQRMVEIAEKNWLLNNPFLNPFFEKKAMSTTVALPLPTLLKPILFRKNSIAVKCIKHILSFLSIDCALVTFYSMGRPTHIDSRDLLKVVLPNIFLEMRFCQELLDLSSFR